MREESSFHHYKELLSRPHLDVHVHTPFSACCEDITLDKLREKAARLKLSYAITDHSSHLYFPRELAWCLQLRDDFPALFRAHRSSGRKNIEKYLALHRAAGVMVGIELDINVDGGLIFEEDLFPELDLVVGGIHVLESLRKKLPATAVVAEFRTLTLKLLSCGKIDVLAHPLRMLLNNQVSFPEELIPWIVDHCARYHIAIEINSHYRYPEEDLQMAKLAMAKKVPLVKGSDAHALKEFGDYTYHDGILRKATGKCGAGNRHVGQE